ncbi:MAG: ABC-F type ribosomal protection protein [Clostridia bacterium]|nr:ABC-F type ribosomal protection protein [Clostridia bacterium]
MIVLACNNVSFSFGTNKILENISFNIQDSEKVGIVGVNGAGKSTLFKMICGFLQPDSGEIFISKDKKIGYLEQNSGLDSSKTIWDELLTAYSTLIDMEKRIKFLEEKISAISSNSASVNEVSLSSLMKEYSALSERFASQGGYEYNSRVKGVLRGLGFSDEQFLMKIQNLSGGQKTRLSLAKLLLEEPDMLLLDEPTNHLDIAALEWLEGFLKNYRSSIVIISHDRYFLDAVTTKTIEIENCNCKTYSGNYSSYIKQKAVDREIQQKHYELQQKEIARMETFIEQQRRWNREKNIIAAESRQKAIDRMEKIDRPKNLPEKVKMKFRTGVISGNDVLFVENLTKEYPGKPLFHDISFKLRKNENVFLLGPNGCGKSTLLKILVGKLEKTAGEFEFGHNVLIGYYDQEQENLDERNTIIDEVWDGNEKLTQTQIRTTLASFLFKGEDVTKPISILSGGEKSRVSLVKLMLSGANLLILDEPTNHLDINSREVLEEALSNFEGTILSVSHDRYFINKLSTRIIEISNTSINDFQGEYSQYLEYRSKNKHTSEDIREEVKLSSSKLERLASKEEKARQRKLLKQLDETEQEITRIELRLSQIDMEMVSEEACSNHVLLTGLHEEQESLNNKLESLYELWENLSQQKEEMGI